MSSSTVLGQYLWHELLTTDPDPGAGFYAKVLGWTKLPYEGDAAYAMLGTAQGPVGGARLVGQDPLATKVGANWLTYVGVPDIAAALAAAEAHGGRVLHPVTQIPGDGGRYAVIADPQGANIGVYEPGAAMSGGSSDPTAGPVVWHELTAENPQAALQFYHTLFGWDVVSTHDMGGNVGTYYLFGKGTTQMGGVFLRSPTSTWPRWMIYLAVPSVTAAVEAVKAAGGKVVNGPHQVPGGNWVAQALDSHGVAVALHGPKEAAAAEKPKVAAKPKTKAKKKAAPVKAKAKSKPKTKSKVKTKAKAKPKAKAKTKSKAKVARKPKAKARVAAKTKGRSKAKSAVKAKRKTKAAARSKSRKAPRRPK